MWPFSEVIIYSWIGFKYAENVGRNTVEEYASTTRPGEYVARGSQTFQTGFNNRLNLFQLN